MAGQFVSLTQDFIDEDGCRDYRQDPIGATRKPDKRKGKYVIMGSTHGCSCCQTTREVTVADLKLHIETLKQDLEEAERALEILKRMG
jgi:hypothetical protein